VVLLAILGSLINPFLRSLRFTDEEESLESREPISVIITAHDNFFQHCFHNRYPFFLFR
jgi:hypothetical protein